MQLYDLLDTLRERWKTVGAVTLLAVAAAVVITLTLPKGYSATARMYATTTGDQDPSSWRKALRT